MFDLSELKTIQEECTAGKWAGLARLVTRVENSPPWNIQLPVADAPVHVVGITGPPGAGKSTLTGRLLAAYADSGLRVGVIAIDPSSPISGGALLGDRLRMEDLLTGRDRVYVRSLASRGSHGAIAAATRNIVRLYELSGAFDIILIETVGAGQTEVAIVELADTVILVTVPGLGDAVQAIKSGLMEIANIFVVNQADRPGAAETLRHLRLGIGRNGVVLETIARDNVGVSEVVSAIDERWKDLGVEGRLDSLRQSKWVSDVALTAEAWINARAKQYKVKRGESLHKAVSTVLSNATIEWEKSYG